MVNRKLGYVLWAIVTIGGFLAGRYLSAQVTRPYPGCSPDGSQGIVCNGPITVGQGSGFTGAITMPSSGGGMVGIAGPVAENGFILLLMPDGKTDGTGKFLEDSGVVPCPPFDPVVVALHPVCHQAAWATP
jgi:hypothetical protein